jgi:hypothetical protein
MIGHPGTTSRAGEDDIRAHYYLSQIRAREATCARVPEYARESSPSLPYWSMPRHPETPRTRTWGRDRGVG